MQTTKSMLKSLADHRQNIYGQIPSIGSRIIPRDSYLQNIHSYLKSDFPVVAISGILGIGKTTVARQYVDKHKPHYEAVLWVNSGSLQDEVSRIFDALLRNEGNGSTKSAELKFDNWFKGKQLPESQKHNNIIYLSYLLDILPQRFSKALLVIDAADESVIDFLNTLPQFDQRVHIIVTTHVQKHGKINLLEIAAHSSEESLLLFKSLIDEKVSKEPDAAVQLAILLKGFPLAASLACKYIKETNISISDYIKIYTEGKLGIDTQNNLPVPLNNTQDKQRIMLVEKVLKEGNLDTVEKFSEQLKQTVLPYSRSPLYYAAANPNAEVIEYLIETLNLDTDEKSSCGITPLLRAAFYGNLKAIDLFLKLGSDPSKTDTLGQDLLGILKRQNHHDLIEPVKILIKETECVRRDKSSGISVKKRKFSAPKTLPVSEVNIEAQTSSWSLAGLLNAFSFLGNRSSQSQYTLLPTEKSANHKPATPSASTDTKLKAH